jgi:glycosyltransferase involved in cell wall biosynthesis
MFVVYDLLPIQMPWAFPEVTEPGYRQWLECISNYDGALCISQSVADQLSDWYARRPASSRSDRFLIRSFPLGSDIEASRPSRGLPPGATESLAQWRAAPTFLMVGTLEPRKCHQQVLDAFELRWQQGSNQQLLIVGRQGWKVDALLERVRRHPELGRRLWWLTGVSDEYLEQLYGVATGLILASLGEGYGLPIVEAMRRGLPVLARDLPVFHEVGGPSLRCFRGNEPEAIAAALASWEHDQAKGCLRRPEPTETVTWQQSAQALLKHLLIPDSDRSDGPVLHPAP